MCKCWFPCPQTDHKRASVTKGQRTNKKQKLWHTKNNTGFLESNVLSSRSPSSHTLCQWLQTLPRRQLVNSTSIFNYAHCCLPLQERPPASPVSLLSLCLPPELLSSLLISSDQGEGRVWGEARLYPYPPPPPPAPPSGLRQHVEPTAETPPRLPTCRGGSSFLRGWETGAKKCIWRTPVEIY